MALGSLQQTITTGANFIPEVWGGVIPATEDKLVFHKLTWDWSESGKGYGDIIHYPAVSNLAANAKAANTQVVLNAPTEADTTLTINRHDECSFLIEDILKVQSKFNLMKFYTDKASFAIAEQMDTRVNTLVASLSQVTGVAGTDIGDLQVRTGVEYLDLANAPEEDRHFAIYPTQKNALFAIEKYFRADQRGDTPSEILVKGKFGQIYGVTVYSTNQVSTSGGARLNAMWHREAWATAVQKLETLSDFIQEYLGTLVTTHAIYGEAEARDAFGVWVRS